MPAQTTMISAVRFDAMTANASSVNAIATGMRRSTRPRVRHASVKMTANGRKKAACRESLPIVVVEATTT